ncbi:spore maturation protein [Syntrophomonas wolfei]|uniref:Nucleoside recognition proteinn n=1 Tax=Syntrophomonas wolfei subsp. wolfei (strain DSM 2245B / Goettingen) TaxID=335541 RepID=Q0AX35_SYNWW|nr:spore maturation protein [Syntrophomonas wolfei]ABI68719.1 nucleoside recognition proteinn [Syntrophomonas wolfei subsp. wolfei str. Goettingen G311]
MLLSILTLISKWAIPFLLLAVPLYGMLKKVPVYESFVEGAEQGFYTAVKIIPFLVGMMVAISVFRASGAMDYLSRAVAPLTALIGAPSEILPLAVMRPLSGSAVLGMSTEIMKIYGPDSHIGRLASVMQGTTDTTFFVLTVYFGSVGIKKYRYALLTGLTADISGFLASVYICNLLFR